MDWNPLYTIIKLRIKEMDNVILIICPFIQLDALKELLDSIPEHPNLKIITRWNAEDIASGVSDFNIFPYLSDKKIRLFVKITNLLKMLVKYYFVSFS